MKRFLSVWFPDWPMERLARARGGPDNGRGSCRAPRALVSQGQRGLRIVAVNRAAHAGGVRAGQPLADARAMLPALKSEVWEEEADASALRALARWCGRYGPQRNTCGRDGVWVDITGVAHLFGDEAGLAGDLVRRLEGVGFTARAGVAETHAGAFALARGGGMDDGAFAIAAPGTLRSALKDLPVATLRLSPETSLVLRRLGLFRIGQLYGLPRASLARRFRDTASGGQARKAGLTGARAEAAAGDVLRRLEEALGQRREPLEGLSDPPVLGATKAWSDPLITSQGIAAEAERLAGEVGAKLAEAGLGARRIALALYRSDGTMAEIAAGMSAPCRDPAHMMRLLAERLPAVDAGFGIDALTLDVREAEAMPGEQRTLVAGPNVVGNAAEADADPCGDPALARLADTLANRLGDACVSRLEPVARHLPEAAQRFVAFGRDVPAARGGGARGRDPAAPWPLPAHVKLARPPFLLSAPEPIRVLAQVPEGAPRRFTWRRVVHDVAHSHGPERIAPEWWRLADGAAAERDGGAGSRTRDYYRVTVASGASYWIFRAGLFGVCEAEGEDGDPDRDALEPRWFLQGIYG